MQKNYFALIFSIKIDFKVLPLLNGLRKSQRLYSIGYTLPYDRPGAIFSLSQVQNFLGNEADSNPPPFKLPKQKGYTPLLATL
jgi:hypothetical protein